MHTKEKIKCLEAHFSHRDKTTTTKTHEHANCVMKEIGRNIATT